MKFLPVTPAQTLMATLVLVGCGERAETLKKKRLALLDEITAIVTKARKEMA